MFSLNNKNFSGQTSGLTAKTLTQQMSMTDNEIEQRKEILKFTPEHAKLLVACSDHIHQVTHILVEEFYEEQTQINEIELLIGDADTMKRLQNAMFGYIQSLFNGTYDSEYVSSRLRIGLVHKRIGVPPKLYLSGIQKLSELLTGAITDYFAENDAGSPHKTIEALDRLITFDVGLVFDTYIRSLTAEIEVGRDRIERHAADLEIVVRNRTEELEKQARNDPLTGLNNQRTFYECINKELAIAKRYQHVLSLIYLDIDGFKKLNDSQGHLAGDKILKQLAQVINNNLRETDHAARYGGDEFCVILPNTSVFDATVFTQRLNTEFAELINDKKISLSAGISQSGPEDFLDSRTLIKNADTNMYKAKKNKGYSVIIDSDETEAPKTETDAIKKTVKASNLITPN